MTTEAAAGGTRASRVISETTAWVINLPETEGINDSPIDINVAQAEEISLPPLEWLNYDLPPKKMKLTNTGRTVIVSGKWHQERPYVVGGPLAGKYVFSQIHLHWGVNNMEGSEHYIDGVQYPGELHVVMYKSSYITQEAALKEKDGVIVMCYMLRLQEEDNPAFQIISQSLEFIQKARCSVRIDPLSLGWIIKKFEEDYFLYWGTLTGGNCHHYVLWFICRIPIGVSAGQMDSLRTLLDPNEEPLRRNFRPLGKRAYQLLHCNPSASKYATLLPLPKESFSVLRDEIRPRQTEVYRTEIVHNNDVRTSITEKSKYSVNSSSKNKKEKTDY